MTQPVPSGPHRICAIELDEHSVKRRSPEIEQERAAALADLLTENHFRLLDGPDGPYDLFLGIEDNRLRFAVRDEARAPLTELLLPVSPFRGIVRDYFMICDSYYAALRGHSPQQLEAIDMGRRATHNEGGGLLQERLADRIEVDIETARRLFTLVCVLHLRNWVAR